MSKFSEDFADTQINNRKLQSMFDVNTSDTLPVLESEKELALAKKELMVEIDKNDPDDIILKNIDRANGLLDKLEQTIENSASARMFEVAATLINAVTQAAASVIGTSQHADELLYKEKVLELKERETRVKEIIGKKDGGKTVNNMIVTDRESLLKIIQDNPEKQGGEQEVVN